MIVRYFQLPTLIVVGLLVGCAKEPAPVVTEPVPVAAEEGPAEVELVKASNSELQEIIASHKGKIVIVDFWATWCINCMELMPHTAELQKQHSKDLVLITVSIDEEDRAAKAEEFLSKVGANATHVISSVGGGEKALDEYELTDGVPHYKFYDREGKLAKILDTDLEQLATEESIDEAVKDLLAAGDT